MQDVNQREPKPQLEQPFYWAMPLKLCILGNGPRWSLAFTLGFQIVGLLCEGAKR